ncbi:hypothetical protein [Lactobacillus selangorensis]|nr:hypothetical protein [Lactobacillus selangorensis]
MKQHSTFIGICTLVGLLAGVWQHQILLGVAVGLAVGTVAAWLLFRK